MVLGAARMRGMEPAPTGGFIPFQARLRREGTVCRALDTGCTSH
jgi:hypothetical protein